MSRRALRDSEKVGREEATPSVNGRGGGLESEGGGGFCGGQGGLGTAGRAQATGTLDEDERRVVLMADASEDALANDNDEGGPATHYSSEVSL